MLLFFSELSLTFFSDKKKWKTPNHMPLPYNSLKLSTDTFGIKKRDFAKLLERVRGHESKVRNRANLCVTKGNIKLRQHNHYH